MKNVIYVGLDVHQDSVSIAVLPAKAAEPEQVLTIPNDPVKVRRQLARIAKEGEIHACYEASGCGYVLHRQILAWGHQCVVIAPSLIPRRPGDRRKTDQRDAAKLAVLYRAGALTPIVVPDEAQEAVRSLVRCREAYVREICSSKHYITKFLLTRGYVHKGTNWTQPFWTWLRSLKLDSVDQVVLDSYIHLLEFKLVERKQLDQRIEDIAFSKPYEEIVRRLRCLRGVETTTAMTLVTEILDFRRFGTPRDLMAYLGLVPSEFSTGGPGKERRGGITKTGNARCRRVLIEAAWKYAHPPRLSKILKQRQAGQPPEVIAIAWKAQHRLHRRYQRLVEKKPKQVAITAIARELVGFIWATALTPITA